MILEIITPEKKLFEDEVFGVQLPGVDGSFEILNRHAPFVSALGKGTIKVLLQKNSFSSYSISGGFVEVLQNKTSVLVENAVPVA
jgi:F-type H+-transporting ATPase subunit epsilon